MNKEIAKKWVKALRSGKYKQGQAVLHGTKGGKDTHCCLGVLCDLYQQDRRSKKKKMLNVDYYWGGVTYDGAETDLPDAVLKWAGMKTNDGTWDIEDGEISNLVYLNDDKRSSFNKIASIIEKNVENL
jgi:hypothetical protein